MMSLESTHINYGEILLHLSLKSKAALISKDRDDVSQKVSNAEDIVRDVFIPTPILQARHCSI